MAQGFAGSQLEWVYVSPTPVLRPPHVLLSFIVRWHGGEPDFYAKGTAAATDVTAGTAAGSTTDSAGSPSTESPDGPNTAPLTSARPPVSSDPGGRRRRRREAEERNGTVPASHLRQIVQQNSDQLSAMVSCFLATPLGVDKNHWCSQLRHPDHTTLVMP